MRKIARLAAAPYYQQIKDILRGGIASGRFKANTPLPDKETLALELGVSAMTLRRAMIELSREGILERVRGRGTFVRGACLPQVRKRSATGTIAVVMPYDQEEVRLTTFYHRILQGIHTAAGPLNLPLTIRKVTQPYANFVADLRMDKTVRGVIIVGFDRDPLLQELTRLTVPAVLLDSIQPSTGTAFDEVNHADEEGAYRAVTALIELGHRDIGLIIAHPQSPFFHARRMGYERALTSHGIAVREERIFHTGFTSRAAYGCMHQLIQAGNLPTAFFCTGDELAVGVMAAALESGMRLPRDLSVVGFADTIEFSAPSLSTVRIPMEEMGKTAIRMLSERFDNPAMPLQRIILPTEWTLRGSCEVPRISALSVARADSATL
jgi:DNA-binding LacI/PurR family transcriptional regulator